MAIRGAELNRRVQVSATKSWGPTPAEKVGAEVDSQVAAPTETRTPTLHRANIAHQRVRMEGWRQRRLGSEEDHSTNKGNYKTDLTLTGLLMEGLGMGTKSREYPIMIDVDRQAEVPANKRKFRSRTWSLPRRVARLGLKVRGARFEKPRPAGWLPAKSPVVPPEQDAWREWQVPQPQS